MIFFCHIYNIRIIFSQYLTDNIYNCFTDILLIFQRMNIFPYFIIRTNGNATYIRTTKFNFVFFRELSNIISLKRNFLPYTKSPFPINFLSFLELYDIAPVPDLIHEANTLLSIHALTNNLLHH